MQQGQTFLRGLKFVPAVLGLSFVLVSANQAWAVNSSVQRACKRDYYRFCPSYSIGTPQLRACMRRVGRRLSPRCISAVRRSGQLRRRR